MASRFQLANSIREASVGDSIMADIEASIKSSGSASTGKGAATAARYLADTDDKVSTMKRRALGARTDAGINPEEDTFVLDKLSGLARDWMTSQLGDDDSTKDDNKKKLSDLISEEAAKPLDENTSPKERFLRTGEVPRGTELNVPYVESGIRDDAPITYSGDQEAGASGRTAAIDAALREALGEDEEEGTLSPDDMPITRANTDFPSRIGMDLNDNSKPKGLMARPDNVDAVEAYTAEVAKADKDFNTAFVKKMADSEGIVDHVDSLGIPTLGYGILPETARNYGFDPDSAEYSDRKVLAAAVYNAMYKEAKTSYSDVFKNLDESQKVGVLSLYINLGELPDGVVTALSSATPDFDAARESLSSVVLGSPRDAAGKRKKDSKNNTIYTSSKGLSKRRAGEYNMLMKGQSGFEPITTVSVEGTKAAPEFVWKDKNDIEIHRYTPTVTGQGKVYQGLDDSNSMTTVDV